MTLAGTLRISTLIVVVAFIAACSKPLTLQQQIISVIREMEAKIEDGERRPFMNHIADEFDGQNGQFDRDGIRGLVIFQLNRYKNLNAQLLPIRVTESGPDQATANFRALVTGGANWLPESGQLYEFVTQWSYQNGDWMLVKANWTPIPLEELIE